MIENYKKPELTIRQQVERIDNFTAAALNVVIIGPDYHSERFGRDPLPTYKNYVGNTFAILASEGNDSYIPLGSEYELKAADVKCVASDGAQAFVDFDAADIGGFWSDGMPRNVLNTGTQAVPIVVVGDGFDTAKLADSVQIGDSIIFTLSGATAFSRICKVVGYEDADTLVLDTQFAPDSAYAAGTLTGAIRVLRHGTFEITSKTVDEVAKKVTFGSPAKFKLAGSEVSVYKLGVAYIEYKALRTPVENEAPIRITAGMPIISSNQEAELGYGVHCALKGGEGNATIYAVRTGGDSVADFKKALDSISVSAKYYLLVPITQERAVMLQVRDHVIAMRKEDKKNFRRAYIGIDSFEAEQLTNSLETATASGSILTFTEAELEAELGENVIIGVGDRVREVGSVNEYTVIGRDEAASGRPDTSIWLDRVPTDIVAGDDLVVIKYPQAGRVTADLVDFAETMDNRNVCLIWTSNGVSTDEEVPTVLPNRFLAANVAGIRGRLPQQQGLTRTNVSAISSSPNMYSTFTSGLQDKLAEHGVFIITQEYEDGSVFIRHQITTETDDGPLAYEDSIGVNFDMITFRIGDVCDAYIGKFNGTEETIKSIQHNVEDVLDSYKLADAKYRELGPPLVDYENLSVGLHPVLKDQFYVSVELVFALPLNRGVVTLKATLNRKI